MPAMKLSARTRKGSWAGGAEPRVQQGQSSCGIIGRDHRWQRRRGRKGARVRPQGPGKQSQEVSSGLEEAPPGSDGLPGVWDPTGSGTAGGCLAQLGEKGSEMLYLARPVPSPQLGPSLAQLWFSFPRENTVFRVQGQPWHSAALGCLLQQSLPWMVCSRLWALKTMRRGRPKFR